MKKLRNVLCLVMVFAMLLCSLSACAGKSSTDASDEITIAFIGNTTGDYAQYGIPVRNAVMMYFDQLNSSGGINGKKVKVLEYDDKGDGVEAVNAFNLAMEKGITAVIGSVLTGSTIALADATYEVNMPQVTASATAMGVTVMEDTGEVRNNVFRACFIDPFQGQKMADYAVNRLNAKTAAVFFQTGSDYSEGLKNAFVEEAEKLGLEIVAEEAFPEGDKDFKAQMTNIAAKDPDVVFCPIYYGEAGLAITAARQAGCTATFLGGDGFGSVKDYASAEDLLSLIHI